jgi:RNA polymerase sigma-70 factor (ECF subfamily)
MSDSVTQVFVDHRELLFSIVYNTLGSVADTEDVLQETWLSWASRNQTPSGEQIEDPRAYLVRMAVNRTLAHRAREHVHARRPRYSLIRRFARR